MLGIMANPGTESLFNLKAVVKLTGLSEHAIRAWEARYDAVVPERTASGRRAYSGDDVSRLRLLAQLVSRGHAIGQIARADNAALQRLLTASDRTTQAEGDRSGAQHSEVPRALTAKIKAALRRFDLAGVQVVLREARFHFGARMFALGVVALVMAEIGELVAAGELTIAHEHALSAVVKVHLMELLFAERAPVVGKRVALATREGDLHEIMLLISGVLCAHHGFDVVYIGPNMPPDALGAALRALKTDAVLLGTIELAPGLEKWPVEGYVRRLASFLGKKHEIWIGGMPRHRLDLGALAQPCRHVRSLSELDQSLEAWG